MTRALCRWQTRVKVSVISKQNMSVTAQTDASHTSSRSHQTPALLTNARNSLSELCKSLLLQRMNKDGLYNTRPATNFKRWMFSLCEEHRGSYFESSLLRYKRLASYVFLIMELSDSIINIKKSIWFWHKGVLCLVSKVSVQKVRKNSIYLK